MRIDAGRSQLYSGLKDTRQLWAKTIEFWDDTAQQEFEEQVWKPLDEMAAEALKAMDHLAQLLHQVRQECERSEFDAD